MSKPNFDQDFVIGRLRHYALNASTHPDREYRVAVIDADIILAAYNEDVQAAVREALEGLLNSFTTADWVDRAEAIEVVSLAIAVLDQTTEGAKS